MASLDKVVESRFTSVPLVPVELTGFVYHDAPRAWLKAFD
jgi:hypothetical protein